MEESWEALGEEHRYPKCRVCGCTDERACPGGCWWVEVDLCSRCAAEIDKRRQRRQVRVVVCVGAAALVLLAATFAAGELGRPGFWAGAVLGVLLEFALVATSEGR